MQPRKDLTAHVWAAPCALADLAGVDAWLAGEATAERLAAKPFTPLPVMGIPGWCAQNENFSFYDDSLVFRPRKAPPNTTTALQPGPGHAEWVREGKPRGTAALQCGNTVAGPAINSSEQRFSSK